MIAETVFLIHSFSKIAGSEFEDNSIRVAKKGLVRVFGLTVSATMGLFAFSLPLAIMGGAYWGLPFGEWLMAGLPLGLFAVFICFTASGFVSSSLVKRGIYSLSEREMKSIWLKRCVVVTVLVALVLYVFLWFFIFHHA